MNHKQTISNFAAVLLLLLMTACQTNPTQADLNAGEAAVARIKAARIMFDERCKTVAGEKIYKTVDNVEGVLLMKLRPQAGGREWADRMWPGAAFARESRADEYIKTFLGYEHPIGVDNRTLPITPTSRGTISTGRSTPGALPGYLYVDVIDEKDGKQYRHRLVYRPRPTSQIGYIEAVLDRVAASDPAPRYAVTFEDHVIPEERALWVASSTIKVLDRQTGEVLGEMTRYAQAIGPASSINPSPWLTAVRCPDQAWTGADTRKFVDQILIPAKEK
ncbi:MAG: hypothetical protein HYY97_00065 [Rhodocyclales bacterium]|nr:hypothetical protein [Rhodocyclales bacterium]